MGMKEEADRIEKRGNSCKSEKVKKAMPTFLSKVESAGDYAGAWLERLELDVKAGKLEAKGEMKGWEKEDFDEFYYVLTGIRRKSSSVQGGGADGEIHPYSGHIRRRRDYGCVGKTEDRISKIAKTLADEIAECEVE